MNGVRSGSEIGVFTPLRVETLVRKIGAREIDISLACLDDTSAFVLEFSCAL